MKGGVALQKRDDSDKKAVKEKRALGKMIVKCREARDGMSQRQLAIAINLPPSNMKYIEDGVNSPTPDVYVKLIDALSPSKSARKKMDEHYMAIRKTPPPDVCKTVMDTNGLVDALRLFEGQPINDSQAEKLQLLLASFAEENRKGETDYAEDL